MRLGIDASNIRDGGGLGHVGELLRSAQPQEYGISKIVVWGGRTTLARMPQRSWLECQHDPLLDQSLPMRAYWQARKLPHLAAQHCDCLLVPGGVFAGNFKPVVVMSQNMLPFEMVELRRYGWSAIAAKLLLLRFAQIRSFRRASGAIFVTRYARSVVQKATGIEGTFPIIPYGINQDFFRAPKLQNPLAAYSEQQPFKLLYVSKLEPYKHQWTVVEAIAQLRQQGMPITLDLIGAPERPYLLRRLQDTLKKVDANGTFINYYGHISYQELLAAYHNADGFVFASSCENLPNIMLEAMAAGLPIACAERGPMPEALGAAGQYFDPEHIASIKQAVSTLVQDHVWRAQAAAQAYESAQSYSWERCANETFSFLTRITKKTHTREIAITTPLNIA